MTLFSWLSPKKKPVPLPESSGLSRMDSTKPYAARQGGDGAAPNGQPANRKNERMARRELLYGVVRESMTRAGVLSSSYKFKVLSLDARGRQFLVMVDLASQFGGETNRLAEIEAMVAQNAKTRFDILVTAVYWRLNEHVAVGHVASQPARSATSRPAPLESGPGPLAPEPVSRPAPLQPVMAASQPSTRFEPLHPDEVNAFKRALASGQTGAEAVAGSAAARTFEGAAKHGPQSYTLLTGFEDTEMPDAENPPGTLSTTQYGDLR
jgi:hypothetical protein